MLPREIMVSVGDASRSLCRSEYILVAVPNLMRAAAWRQVAAESGHETVIVRDGDEAQQQIATRGVPILMIAALSLPKVDGFALLRYLRSQPSGDSCSVVAVSAHQPMRAIARELSESLKITEVLPFDADQTVLRDAVNTALRTRGASTAKAASATFTPETPTGQPKSQTEIVGRAVVDAALRFGTVASAIYLRDQRGEHLTVFSSTEGPAAMNAEPDDWSFVRDVAVGGEPLVIPNVSDHPLFAGRATGIPHRLEGLVAVPIFPPGHRVNGVLCLVNRPFLTMDAAEIDGVTAFTEALARDIDAAMTHTAATHDIRREMATLEQLAMTDSLTGLCNRRGAERTIANEVSRARRLGTSVSCLLVDIDQFKRINDTLGHLVGDDVLRHISRVLKKTVRAYDTVSRWGGEEFLLVLPGVELDQAQRLAERLRIAVQGLKADAAGTVTISIGVATLGTDYDFETTLRAADQQLYRAKQSGRNCVF